MITAIIRRRLVLWANKEEVAGAPGFEPGYADPESAVLPLDDAPVVASNF